VRLIKSVALVFTFISITGLSIQGQTPPQAPGPGAQPLASPTPTPTPLPPPTVRIDNYRAAAARIIGAALTSDRAYSRLAHLTDHIGNRISGSKNLERAIEWAVAEMKRDGLDNVRAEKVMVPHWVRGEESLEMLTPVPRKLQVLGWATASALRLKASLLKRSSCATSPSSIGSANRCAERSLSTTRRLRTTEQLSLIACKVLRVPRAMERWRRSCAPSRQSVCKRRTRAR
jgi:hypothetical protein